MTCLVIQSHRLPLPHSWLKPCLDSVNSWAQKNNLDYRFLDDELFSVISNKYLDKFDKQKVILTDLARLIWLKKFLQQGYERVIWCDADFLIFNQDNFVMPDLPYGLGREVWIQHDKNNRLRAYKKIHNAFMLFSKDNVFLDFYIDTAQRLLQLNTGTVPPQFIGPKLLTALHNIARLPVIETAGMLSPLVIKDLLDGGGEALRLFQHESEVPPAGANLSSSVAQQAGLSETQMSRLINVLCDE